MEKPADANFPIHDLIRRRWSPRAFSPRPVESEKLLAILEAARWAASSFNEQPWSFLVATREDTSEHDRMVSCLVEGNMAWARGAPVLMLSVAKLFFEKNGKPNRHAFHDVGLAVENLVIQATVLGLFVHQMAGFSVEKARQLFGIPDGQEPVAAIALGYPADPETLTQQLREKEMAPRVRKSLQEFVFMGQWSRTFPLVK